MHADVVGTVKGNSTWTMHRHGNKSQALPTAMFLKRLPTLCHALFCRGVLVTYVELLSLHHVRHGLVASNTLRTQVRDARDI